MKTRKGISLIVLIITIIVVIILSVTIILTLSKNNVFTNAKEARFKEDIRSFQNELEMYKSGMILNSEDTKTLNATKTSTPSIQTIITSMSDDYAKILQISGGKLIYTGDKKDVRYEYATNLGIIDSMYVIDDDEYTEYKPFITEWTVEAGDSITLPIKNGVCDFTVDYGDGTGIFSVTTKNSNDKTHTYQSAGKYTVTIIGKCSIFSFIGTSISRDKVTKLVQWGDIACTVYAFSECTNLSGTIPEPSKNSFKELTDASALFFGCTNIVGTIPENLFKGANKIQIFGVDWGLGTFKNCTGLTGEIPERLFEDCVDAQNFAWTFYGCTGLTGKIPEKLFKNCSKVTTFSGSQWANTGGGTFENCTGLTSIPEKLFYSCTMAKDFTAVFKGCSGITGTIKNLFLNCNNANDFAYAFYGCTGITEVEDIFSQKSQVTTFNSVFCNCTGLEKISSEIFKGCNEVTDFTSSFTSCISLKEIPKGIFDDCVNVTTFLGAFKGCKSITEIPDDLFKYNVNVTTFSKTWTGGLFQECTGIQSLPKDLFRYNTKATTMAGAFLGCTNLVDVPTDIISYNTELTDINGIFYNCLKLELLPDLSNNLKLTNVYISFQGCTNMQGTVPELWNNTKITSYSKAFYDCKKLSNYADIPAGWKY